MTDWKYTDASRSVVVRALANGRVESCLSSALPNGTLIAAEDAPPPPSQNELDAAAARQYAKLVALKSMTPAQIQAWVSANVTNLAQAQDAIATLAIAVGILARSI